MAYATVADVEARWRELTPEESARATALLEDASAILDAVVRIDGSEKQGRLLCQVCCNMVIRSMGSSVDSFGATSSTVMAGVYQQTLSYEAPTGDMYLTKLEKRLLGVSSGYIGSIPVKVDGYYD